MQWLLRKAGRADGRSEKVWKKDFVGLKSLFRYVQAGKQREPFPHRENRLLDGGEEGAEKDAAWKKG